MIQDVSADDSIVRRQNKLTPNNLPPSYRLVLDYVPRIDRAGNFQVQVHFPDPYF